MLKHLAILAVAVFVLAAAPTVQAAPAAGLLSLKNTQSAVEPVYWRYHQHVHHYRYWRRPIYWGHRHYWRQPVYWRHHRQWRYYRYYGPARRRCGWWW